MPGDPGDQNSPDDLDDAGADSETDAADSNGGTDGVDGDPPDLGPDDGDAADVVVPVVTAKVSHKREMRGTWIATVWNINWPKTKGATAQKAELESILDAVKKTGLNAVFFQVRPEADALYDSKHEPWSRFLTGTQGNDPGYDPLLFAIDAAHQRGIELHAWINPYRARSGGGTCSSDHVSKTMPQAIVTYGSDLWFDPGHPDAFSHTLSVIDDLLDRYDIDGIHFDDYFYPYPNGTAFPDASTYAAHGGGMNLGDWRRDNVNRMVKAVGNLSSSHVDVRWGISPFGIYRPGTPPGVTGLDQYEAIYADPLKWMQEKWLEYIAPQLYWATTSAGQPYVKLLNWWDAQAAASGTALFIGSSASNGFTLNEYRAEMNAVREAESGGATGGAIWYSVDPILGNTGGLASMLASEYYSRPAATPKLTHAADTPPPVPVLDVEDGDAVVLSDSEGIRYWAVYRQVGGDWEIERLIPSSVSEFHLPDGAWAVSAIDRSGRESLGVVVEGSGEEPEPPVSGASCVHTNGGVYVDRGCSPGYQCCDGTWRTREFCGTCVCEESTGQVGCGT